ncbi:MULTISPECIES: DUF2955 domain-containing protein [Rhizobium]|uniref:DUF2955 domain-containing protein n=1 Tax=Rhizobium TaxID=379 RepID=UPI0007EBDF71|nr:MULTISPECIES: DUF2955 domain-containing protein [Rhizobium]ANK92063.1 hypothetical protein AMK01_CH02614 [Rhizobium sp. N6212]ANK98097.1 hypothetical protein AMK00_CH02617 [Rhizobium sp. N621]ANL04177.1 hypothetical protein AMJ99_CH02645 [Rhizobium esperanzae]ANL10223.1 hypothetical protein AMJ98_CH02567 [Rhizobium sp. N1341]ANL22275.1 hypothetical protein AMJ96_CH02574 [Rhizobium sp. N113]
MSADGEQKRKGLRVAFAVSIGFTLAVHAGAVLPFLGPLVAAQFLLGSSRPMPPGKTIGAAMIIVFAGMAMMALTDLLGERPVPFLLILGLTYFACFALQSAGRGPAVFLVLVVSIIVPLLGILNKELASSILSILVAGVLSGAVLMWLAYAIFPEPVSPGSEAAAVEERPPALLRALANAFILLTSVVICLTSDNLSAAAVIPITVASLLGQLNVAASARAAIGMVLVNFLGGVLASVAYAALSLRPSLLSIFLILLVVALLIGGRAAARSKDARVFAGILTIFLILFGLGVSPLPGSAAESFASRIAYVAAALIYALLLSAILWPPAEGSRLHQAALKPDVDGR